MSKYIPPLVLRADVTVGAGDGTAVGVLAGLLVPGLEAVEEGGTQGEDLRHGDGGLKAGDSAEGPVPPPRRRQPALLGGQNEELLLQAGGADADHRLPRVEVAEEPTRMVLPEVVHGAVRWRTVEGGEGGGGNHRGKGERTRKRRGCGAAARVVEL